MTKVQKKYLKPGVAGLTVTALVIGLSSRLTQAQMIKHNTRGAKPAGLFDHQVSERRILQDEDPLRTRVSVMGHSSKSKSGKATPSPAPTDDCSDSCFVRSHNCTDSNNLPACDGSGVNPFDIPVPVAIGDRCRGYSDDSEHRPPAFCGTDNDNPNCARGNGLITQSVFERVACTPAPSPSPTSKSGKATPSPTDDCSDSCFEALPLDSQNCTDNGQLPACDGSGVNPFVTPVAIAIGDLCRGYNDESEDRPPAFCGTDNLTPNCRSPKGVLKRSVYIKVDC